jgi:hypothetical protein
MKLEEVESSNIKSIGYDPEKKIMHVVFNSGKTYEYTSDDMEFSDFQKSPSKGKFFNEHIRGRPYIIPKPEEEEK